MRAGSDNGGFVSSVHHRPPVSASLTAELLNEDDGFSDVLFFVYSGRRF